MSSTLPSLFALAHSRITEFELDAQSHTSRYNHFYHGPETYIEGLHDELAEVEAEMQEGNHILLEDELGDVFWDYICLLESLHQQGYISAVDRPFERAYQKFSERIEAARDESRHSDIGWQEVKTRQKEELRGEQESLVYIFTYGTLRDPAIQMRIFGRILHGTHTSILDYRLSGIICPDHEIYPLIVPAPGQSVDGILYRVSGEELQKADIYEDKEYIRTEILTQSGVLAQVYIQNPALLNNTNAQ